MRVGPKGSVGRPGLAGVLLWALTCVLAGPAGGQDAGGQDAGGQDAAGREGGAPTGTPPRMVRAAEVDAPEEALPERGRVAVELELVVGTDGTVRDARVLEAPNQALGEAARRALERSRFEPARIGGEPVAARIRYRWVFEALEPPEPPVEAEVGPRDAGLGEAGAGADGTASPPQEDRDELPIEAEVIEDDEGFGAVARVERPARELTRRTIEGEELTQVAGTGGDALRVVELLPGVGRPPFGAGLLVVRGSAPQDSQAFFDGAPVPLIYHFGGLTSFTNSRLLERIDFYPGNFSVRYGRKVGGILEAIPRDPSTEGFHGYADVNLLDASFLVEGPVSDELSVAASARRSYVDFFFENVVPRDTFDVVVAPVYYDYQLYATWRPNPRNRLRVQVYGSSDRLALIFAEPLEGDPIIRGDLEVRTEFHRIQAELRTELSNTVTQELSLAVGPALLRYGLGDAIDLDSLALHAQLRAEWRARLSPRVAITAGTDTFVSPWDFEYLGPSPRQAEGNSMGPDPLSAQPPVRADATGVLVHPGFYLESDLRPWDPLQLVLGLRVDWFSEIDAWTFDPRAVTVLSVSDRTDLKFGAGLFSQPPGFQESNEKLGNPSLEPTRAVHLGAGVEHALGFGFTVGTELFYKYLWDRVVEAPPASGEVFSNAGEGRIYGVETFGRVPVGRSGLFALLSYTLSRSERRDGPDQAWRLFDFDQTHILTLAGGMSLGNGWDVGAAFRLISGNPYTPIVGGEFLGSELVYQPVFGDINSERNPLFHRLDARVEKTWDFDAWRLALRLDVQNVYNQQNPEGEVYNYDFTERQDLPGLPIIPSIGVRGEM